HPPGDAGPRPEPGRGERGRARRGAAAGTVLAAGAARGARLAFPLDRAAALVAGMVQGAPAPAAAGPDRLGRGRLRPAPLHPELTNYRYGWFGCRDRCWPALSRQAWRRFLTTCAG